MLKSHDILYVDTGTINWNNPRIYQIEDVYVENGKTICNCYLYHEHKDDIPDYKVSLMFLEEYIRRASVEKDVKCLLIDEAELAKFLLERNDD